MTSNAEEPANMPVAGTAQPPKATKRANVAPHKRRVTPGKPRSEKKASSAEQWPKNQKAAKQAKPTAGARAGSKAAKVLGLPRRSDGASLKELMKATGWLAHSVRGFLVEMLRSGWESISCMPRARKESAVTPPRLNPHKAASTKKPPGITSAAFFERFPVGTRAPFPSVAGR